MKVNSLQKNNTNFNGFYNSKGLKSVLKFAADNSYLFAGTTSLVLSTCVRPISILLTPKTDKENKKYACSKALASSAIGYSLILAISIPFAKSVGKINNNPEKFLKKETIQNLKENADKLTNSKSYKLATQMFKLGLGFIVAAPKAILTALGVPVIMNGLFYKKNINEQYSKSTDEIYFKGKKQIPTLIGKIIDNSSFQEFAKKHKESNFPMHMMALTDTISTGVFVTQITKSNKIEEKRKNPLIYNSVISTALSILSSYIIDKALNKPTVKFIEHLKEANKNSQNLEKYIEGVKIAKPAIIMGIIYYMLIPLISTFIADRVKSDK